MELIHTKPRKIGQVAGLFGAVFAITVSNPFPSQAGVVNEANASSAVGIVAGAAVGAIAGGAVVGSFAGPPGAAAVGAAAGAGVVVSAITYTVVTQAIAHPQAAAQSAQLLNPITAPIYVVTHPTQVVSGVKQVWNYFFG
ncbi:MAG: hypothetical protein ACKOXI_04780 [Candidatus Planktophila sp.]